MKTTVFLNFVDFHLHFIGLIGFIGLHRIRHQPSSISLATDGLPTVVMKVPEGLLTDKRKAKTEIERADAIDRLGDWYYRY